MKKLVLIDGMAAIYRGYYAMSNSPRVNSKGFNTSAALGFTSTLLELLRKQRPSHIGVAFDLPAPTFRHIAYPDYKAHRDPMPEEIQTNLPWVHRIIDAFRIPRLSCEGFEADDVIGTLSHAAESAGFDQVMMVTPDKDFAQLVTPKVILYRYGRGKVRDSVMGVDEVCKKFGVANPRQVIDLLGLWGDSSDNIPGVRGVGEKTAQKLIAQFGSIEAALAHLDEIKNDRLRENLGQCADQALFSKKLATIRLDAPIPFSEEALRLAAPDYEALKEICDQLEFRQLLRRIASEAPSIYGSAAPVQAPPVATPSSAAGTAQQALNLFGEAQGPAQAPEVVAEPLTADVLRSLAGTDVGIIVAGPQVALSAGADKVWTAKVGDLDLPLFRSLLASSSAKICFDLKTLRYALDELQAPLGGSVFDIQLAHYLVDPEMRHSFDYIASGLVGVTPSTPAHQAATLWQLYPLLISRLRDAGMERLYGEVELPLVDVLLDMERAGVRIDTAALAAYARRLAAERDDLERVIYAYAGHPFNIASPRQLGEVLYEQLKITEKPPRTATHQYSTAEETLTALADRHPVVPLILEHRSLTKLIGTYLESLPKLISPVDHRLHTVYNQTVTATGRLSSSNPNLQNIPIRTDRGREIRRAFIPADSDHLILAADYSQVELRIIASLSRDRHLLEAFNSGQDIHAATAARIFGISIEEVSKDQRRHAKSVNFGIVYGISAFGLSQQLGIPRKEASELIENYFDQYPDVQRYIEESKEFARKHGYARTLLGRRRYLPDINSRNAAARTFAERNAVNMPIQGTSADMIKIAMVRIHNLLLARRLRSKLILQIHDELVFDLYRPEEEELRSLVVEQMQTALPLEGLTLEVGIDVGANWLDAH